MEVEVKEARSKTAWAPGLERGLAILELIGESRRGMTLSDIARKLQLPKSTAHSLLVTLRETGYVSRTGKNARYFFGERFFRLSNLALGSLSLGEHASKILLDLHESTRLTVHLAALDRHDVVLIEKYEAQSASRVATWIGRRMEVHCTSLGKAILAHLPETVVDAQLRAHGLPKHNENTLSTARKLKVDLERARALGYALDDEEDEIGYRCIAAPVFDGNGRVAAAVSVAGTTEQITRDNLNALAAKVVNAAGRVTSSLKNQGRT